jgi:hypothetical protein
MSLQIAAKHLESKGRGPDNVLVHMSFGELKSLQDLAKAHGGSLTVNPETGLPEAGFLRSILPMVAGAALAPFTGGLSAAMLVGGGTALASGNLRKGLMAGLGAYGGAGLGQALTGAGASVVGDAAGQLAGPVGSGEYGFAASKAIADKGALGLAGEGVQGLFTEPGRAAFMRNIGNGSGLLKTGLAAAAPMLLGGEQAPAPQMAKSAPPVPLEFNPNAVTPTPQPDVPEYGQLAQDFGRQQRYFNPSYTVASAPMAPTTAMPMMAAGGPVEEMSARNDYETMLMNRGQMFAKGGVSHLGDYSDGGRLLRGPGDGVSDSIPATIANKRPARLADGEFVVPARIVSELGNGSTEAGARKLYAMMDRVQKRRAKTIGKGKVAVNSRAEKLLPA